MRGGGYVNEDEIREALKKIRVEDVLLQTAATLIDLAARRMGLAEDDGPTQLDQAKLAIDAIRALQPLMTEEQQAALREPLSQLQIAYAREAQGGAASPTQEPEPEEKPEDDAERAKARSKIWTPPGT
jgi:hypothetical protein